MYQKKKWFEYDQFVDLLDGEMIGWRHEAEPVDGVNAAPVFQSFRRGQRTGTDLRGDLSLSVRADGRAGFYVFLVTCPCVSQ